LLKELKGGVLVPLGFTAAGTHCGIKTKAGVPDIGIIFSETPACAAGVFTTNEIKAAPVRVSQEHIRSGIARAIVVNSGNANACTGRRGLHDAAAMAALVAARLKVSAGSVLVASTGIIGHLLPMKKVRAGIEKAARSLGRTPKHDAAITRAIMTTDTFPKQAAVSFTIGGKTVRMAGIVKGAGMIAPRMATMLAFITTDAAVTPALLRKALRQAADLSFNHITVDGHTSTNDTCVILAGGKAGNRMISREGPDFRQFCEALDLVAVRLAKLIVKDGEGASKFVEVTVQHAPSDKAAADMAREIAESPLVKTALNGCDPNWGRIVSAAGYAGTPLDERKMRLTINGLTVYKAGVPATSDAKRLSAAMRKPTLTLVLDCGSGRGSATFWTCDLSHGYIKINAEYHT
jgi:glutamate N-acetyltransferase/amino-acid N-acetyltransferase